MEITITMKKADGTDTHSTFKTIEEALAYLQSFVPAPAKK